MNARSSAGPRRVNAWVLRWAKFYTRGLPSAVARDRRDEVASDLFEQQAQDAATRPIGRAIARRALLGAPADLSWREHELRKADAAATAAMPAPVAMRTRRLIVLAHVLSITAVVVGIAATIRSASNQNWAASPEMPLWLGIATAFMALGLVVMSRPATRFWGSLLSAAGIVALWWFLLTAAPSLSAQATRLIAFTVTTLPRVVGLLLLVTPGLIMAVILVGIGCRLAADRRRFGAGRAGE